MLSFSFFARDALCHQATLLRRDLFERVGRYDESFAIAADWIFTVLAVCRDQCSYQGHPLVLSVYYHDGISSMPENQIRLHRERDAALRRYLPRFADAANVLATAGREAEELQALWRSTVIQTLQRLRLLWQF